MLLLSSSHDVNARKPVALLHDTWTIETGPIMA